MVDERNEESENNSDEEKVFLRSAQCSTFDRTVLVHFFVVFTFSFLMGIIIIHSSLLWHHFQSITGADEEDYSFFAIVNRQYGFQSKAQHKVDLTANTSVYVM